jgi:hypothetical protein
VTQREQENEMGAEVFYELNLEPLEDGRGWTAMVYRSVRAGVCGPWSDTKPVPDLEDQMFVPVDQLAARGLLALGLAGEFEPGVPEVYGRYGSVALSVPLTRIEQRQRVPVFDDGGRLVWVDGVQAGAS